MLRITLALTMSVRWIVISALAVVTQRAIFCSTLVVSSGCGLGDTNADGIVILKA
jgi:hypothetical protein